LKVRLGGICDTDLQLARGYMGFRGVLGHEFVGETADGRRVTAEINNACHQCSTCASGMPGHCPNRTVLGILGHDGALAEYVTVPTSNLHALPDTVDDRAAVFVEPLAAAFRMVEQVEPGPGTRVAILGDGKLGLLCTRVARLTGAEVTLIGKHPEKLALAGAGVDTCLLPESTARSRSYDLVVDCTGSRSGLPTALRLVRPRGTLVLKTTLADRYEIDLSSVVIDEIRLVGSRCGPFGRAIEALAENQVDVQPLIGAEFELDHADEALAAAAHPGARKVLIWM
jgi:threonine dehydrogenase-like Zn-dependent dehydrogenase